jgi:hypothetical protein
MNLTSRQPQQRLGVQRRIVKIGLGILFLIFCTIGIPIYIRLADGVVATTWYGIKNAINPHSFEESRLQIGWHAYRRVKGSRPFYVKSPDSRYLFFVVGATWHLYDRQLSKDVSIYNLGEPFGTFVGDGTSIEKCDGTNLTMSRSYWSYDQKRPATLDYKADLVAKKIVAAEIRYFSDEKRTNIVKTEHLIVDP